jgi:hypothetical protein
MPPFLSQVKTIPARRNPRPLPHKSAAPRLEPLENRRLLAVGPDGFGYRGDSTPALDYDLSAGDFDVITIFDRNSFDDETTQIQLGADTFNFYGENFSSIWVSTNGLITVGDVGNSAHLNSNLTNTPTQRAIAPFWDDLITLDHTDSRVMYTLEDRNNNGVPERLIIEWQNVVHGGHNIDENPLTFQAILQLNTGSIAGDIYFNYLDVDAGSTGAGQFVTNGAEATVGIKDAFPQSDTPTARRLLVSYNQNNNPLIGSGKAIKISTTGGDNTPPQISSGTFSPQTPKPQLTVVFSEDVGTTLTASDLELLNLTTNTPVTPPEPVYNAQTNTAVFTFDPATLPLPDGNYRATLRAGSVSDSSGNATTSDLTFDFYVLAADVNRDRAVDFNDLAVLAQNYNTVGGMTFAQGDFNYDTNVDFNDLAMLAQRYNSTLAPPAAGAVAAAPPELPAPPAAKKKPAPVFNATVPVRPTKPAKPVAKRR